MSVEHIVKHIVLLHIWSYNFVTAAVIKHCCPSWRDVKSCLTEILTTYLPFTDTSSQKKSKLLLSVIWKAFWQTACLM